MEVVSKKLLRSEFFVEVEVYNAVCAVIDNLECPDVFNRQSTSFLKLIRLDVRPVFKVADIISRDIFFDSVTRRANEFFSDFNGESCVCLNDIGRFNNRKRDSRTVSGNSNCGNGFTVVILCGNGVVYFLNALSVDINVCRVIVVRFETCKFGFAYSEVEIHGEGISCGHCCACFVFRYRRNFFKSVRFADLCLFNPACVGILDCIRFSDISRILLLCIRRSGNSAVCPVRFGVGRHMKTFKNGNGIAYCKCLSGINIEVTAHHVNISVVVRFAV